MNVLLTGATGLLGNNILRLLIEQNHNVTIVTRRTSDSRATSGIQVDKVYIDLAEPDELGKALDGIDLVIHSAALIRIGWSRLDEALRVNVDATRELARAARLKKARMILVSTVDTLGIADSINEPVDESGNFPNGNPACTYVVSKTKSEEAFVDQIEKGLDGIIVHPGFMVGPNDWKPSSGEMMLTVAKQFVYFAPAGGCSVVDVRDVADGVYLAARKGNSGERYILAGSNLSYLDLWTKMAAVTGGRTPRKVLPGWLASLAGTIGDTASRILPGAERTVNSAAVQMGQLNHYYTSDKAIAELGYKIGSVDDALADAWDWFKAFDYA